MIGGMASSTVLTLLVIPAIYGLVKGWPLRSQEHAHAFTGSGLIRQ
jgi:Cu(I)/Ag(I) efflux system membrane protein CusA/SilA